MKKLAAFLHLIDLAPTPGWPYHLRLLYARSVVATEEKARPRPTSAEEYLDTIKWRSDRLSELMGEPTLKGLSKKVDNE